MEETLNASTGVELNIVSCNVCKASFDNAAEVVEDLLAVQRGICCVQEVASWP